MTGGLFDAAVIAINGAIGFASESWTEQTIASLDTDETRMARVLRDSSERIVPADQLAPTLSECCSTDERSLAGERIGVQKHLPPSRNLRIMPFGQVDCGQPDFRDIYAREARTRTAE